MNNSVITEYVCNAGGIDGPSTRPEHKTHTVVVRCTTGRRYILETVHRCTRIYMFNQLH